MISHKFFGAKDDHGTERTKPTPEPNEILTNLQNFIQKWQLLQIDNKNIITVEAIVEIDKLKVHIKKGCLSGIVVSGGLIGMRHFTDIPIPSFIKAEWVQCMHMLF